MKSGLGRIWPLPRKHRELIFHLRGGVLPPIPPTDVFRDLFEDFNRESDEVTPLERVDEAPSGLEEQQEVGQGGSIYVL